MNRREFCHKLSVVGGLVAISPLLNACSSASQLTSTPAPLAEKTPYPSPIGVPEPTATQSQQSTVNTERATAVPPTSPATNVPESSATARQLEGIGMATIALVNSNDRSQGLRKAIELLDFNPVSGRKVLLKPNFNSADEAPGSTHPDILEGLLLALMDMGAGPITVGDRSGMGETRRVMEQKGVFDLAADLGFETVIFDELEENDWVIQRSGDFHWSDGFAVPRILLDTESIVQTCNLKTHQYGGHFTMSLKNSVGFAAKISGGGNYNYMTELHNSPYQRDMIAEINTAYTPSLIVMDGVEAFVNGGPDKGKKANTEVILAGTDRVAMDAVGVAILRLFGTTREVSRGKVFEQEQIARAVELGLGIDSPDKIQFVTTDAASEAYAGRIQEALAL